VSWLEEEHPQSNEIREVLDWPKAKHWLRFQFNAPPNLHELPESFAPEENDESFLKKAESLWSQLDAIYEELISSLGDGVRINSDLLKSMESKYNLLDDYFETQIGHPSPQCQVIDKMLGRYLSTMDGAFCWLKGKENVNEATRVRWLRQNATRLVGFYRAFEPLKNVLHEG
jgi:hypothetical protein